MTKIIVDKRYRIKFNETDNVSIQFAEYETYIKSLSKSTRQNLRTAKNRIQRDSKDLKLVTNFQESLSKQKIDECISIYAYRQENRYGSAFLNRLSINTINYTSSLMRKSKGFLIILEIDNKVGAFMFGYMNKECGSFEVPRLAINNEYSFYSPGMLLVDKSIEFFTKNTTVRCLDLCRGTEPYKMKMNGGIYNTLNFTIDL